MNQTFLECKMYGNTLVSKSSDKNYFLGILYNSVYYEFLIDLSGQVTSILQSLAVPEYLIGTTLGKYVPDCLLPQLN